MEFANRLFLFLILYSCSQNIFDKFLLMFPPISRPQVIPCDQTFIHLKPSVARSQTETINVDQQQINYEQPHFNYNPIEVPYQAQNSQTILPENFLYITPEKRIVNNSQVIICEKSPNDVLPNPNENVTWTDTFNAKKWWILGIGIGLISVIVIAIILGVLLSRKQKNQEGSRFKPFTCQQSPSECAGVPPEVSSFIFSNYSDPDQVRSLLQTSRSFNIIPTSNTTNVTRQNLTDAFRNISRSVQCLSLNLPDTFDEAFQKLSELQFTTQQQIAMYISMTESFSGQPLKLVSEAGLAQTCRFNLSESRRRRLQLVSQNNTAGCTSNATSVLIYFSGLGYSPSSAIQNVRRMQEILSTNSSTNFDAGIIALGAWRSDLRLGYFSGLISSYQSYLNSNGRIVPNRWYLYSTLRMILNLCRDYRYLPSGYSNNYFSDLLKYYVQRSIYSFTNEPTYYEFARHKDFVTQQISEGKKVVLLAHAEGTVYANNVYNLLNSTQKQSVKLVYVAPTVNSMADNSTNYITNPYDTIISTIRANAQTNISIPVPLPVNMAAVNFTSETNLNTNHELPGYAQSYKEQLTQLIVSAKSRAVQPVRSMGNGPITITLTWDNQPDNDLHVIQPNNLHVFYGHKNGQSGHLDVDDTSSYGPEHYYTNCNLKQGNYTVYIHFYGGYSRSSTITTVSAGTEYFMKSVDYSPNQSAQICKIGVFYDNSTSLYQFTIYPA